MNVHNLLKNAETPAKWLTDHMPQQWWRSIRYNMCFNEWRYLQDVDILHKCTDKFDYTLQDLIRNCNSIINMPKRSVLDEIRTIDNSRKSRFGTFIRHKPIKRGRTTDAVCVKSLTRNRHTLDGLSIALNTNKGTKDTYDESIARLLNPAQKEGKTDNKVHQIIKWESENDVVMDDSILSVDKGCNSIYVLEKVLPTYGMKGVGPIQDGRKCLPKVFSSARFKKLRKKMKKGDFKQWYTNEGTHLTLFRDSKFVNIFDNCIDQDKLAVIYRRRKKKERGRSRRWKQRFVVPKVIEYYNKTMGSVDASNSRRKKHMIGNKHPRKNNRCYMGLFDQVVLQNAALLYAAYKGWKKVDQNKLRIELCREWVRDYERLLELNGGVKRIAKKKTDKAIEDAVMRRGLGTNHVHRLVHIGRNRRNRIKCHKHTKTLTWYKCDTCSVFGQETGFCHPDHCRGEPRTCFADYRLHGHHEIHDD